MTFDRDALFRLDDVLLCAVAEIAVFGWVPSSHGLDAAGKVIPKDPTAPPSTKDRVVRHFTGSDDVRSVMRTSIVNGAKAKGLDLFADTLKQQVAVARKWAQQQTGPQQYQQHIRFLAEQTTVAVRDFGFAVSIIHAYETAHRTITSPSVYLGKVGDSLTTTLVATHLKPLLGFGLPLSARPDRMRVVGTQVGTENVIVFYTKLDTSVAFGRRVVVKGKVYRHGISPQGVRETQLHYVKWERA